MNKTLIPGNPRLNAKTKEAGKLATASEMANAGFADAALAQGIATQTQGQNGQNSQANKRVPGETAYGNPRGGNIPPLSARNPEAERLRQASLTKNNIVVTKNKPSDLGISDIEAEALDVSTLKKKGNEEGGKEGSEEDDKEGEMGYTPRQEFDESYPEESPSPLNDSTDIYDRIIKKIGNKFTRADIEKIRKTGSKVKLPIAYILISIFNFFTSIVLGLMSALFFVIGLGIDLGGIAAAIFTFGISLVGAGTVGAITKTIGIGMGIMSFFSSLALAVSSVIAQIYYLRTASIVVRRGEVLTKYFWKLLTIRSVTILFGWVPLLNGFIFFAGGRSFYRLVKRETQKVKDIIEEEFRKG